LGPCSHKAQLQQRLDNGTVQRLVASPDRNRQLRGKRSDGLPGVLPLFILETGGKLRVVEQLGDAMSTDGDLVAIAP